MLKAGGLSFARLISCLK